MTLYPLEVKSFPSEAAMIPLPKEEVTPPVTNIYFVEILFTVFFYKNNIYKYKLTSLNE